MRTRILTLPFDVAHQRFDDAELMALQETTSIVRLSIQPIEVLASAFLLCVATCACEQAPLPAPVPAPAAPSGSVESDRPRPRDPGPDLDGSDRESYERIRAWRNEAAQREGVPPYVILTNRQVREIARQRPASPTALQRIHGIGPKKVERHGEQILALVASHVAEAAATQEAAR